MFELERLAIFRRKPGNLEFRPEATRDGKPWEFVGGIQFNRQATILASDGQPVLHVYLKRPETLGEDLGEADRTLVKRFPDGSVKYLLISFPQLVE